MLGDSSGTGHASDNQHSFYDMHIYEYDSMKRYDQDIDEYDHLDEELM